MSQTNYIKDLLKIKDKNIYFYENIFEEGFIKGKKCNIINSYLSYIPEFCINCGCIFESIKDYEKKGFDKGSYVVYPSVVKYDTYIFLKKQRIKCLHCNSSFSCSTSLVKKHSYISNKTKHSIVHDLMKKRSEKDIALDNNVSSNTVERVIDSYYDSSKSYNLLIYLLMNLNLLKMPMVPCLFIFVILKMVRLLILLKIDVYLIY